MTTGDYNNSVYNHNICRLPTPKGVNLVATADIRIFEPEVLPLELVSLLAAHTDLHSCRNCRVKVAASQSRNDRLQKNRMMMSVLSTCKHEQKGEII